jgi:chromosome segregation ATPase
MATLTLSIVEIIVLMLGAIVLGITIHFFIISRRTLNNSTLANSNRLNKTIAEWKLKYFNDIESRDKELSILRKHLEELEETSNINEIEAEEMRKENKKLLIEMDHIRKTAPQGTQADFVTHLKLAQANLLEQNEKIGQLLRQVDVVKESKEEKEKLLQDNAELTQKIADLEVLLSQKQKEVRHIQQKEVITSEMNSMLDSAYNEFHLLQEKIQKLEAQVSATKVVNMEFEDLREGYYKMTRDFDENKDQLHAFVQLNQELKTQLSETEDKLKEANFQRQQLQKRVSYLEGLHNDMKAVSDANKRLEGQLKRIGELESMLNVISEERDELARRQMNA